MSLFPKRIDRVVWFLGLAVVMSGPLLIEVGAQTGPVLAVPPAQATLHLRIAAPSNVVPGAERTWQLVEVGVRPTAPAPAGLAPAVGLDGSAISNAYELVASISPGSETSGSRLFRLEAAGPGPEQGEQARFRIEPVSDKSLGLYEGNRAVLVYNHGVISRDGVPADRARSTYIHPLYGLDGEVLTDDFPEDHHHHRGLFWAWPHVSVGGKEYDLWMLKGVRHKFKRWLGKEVGSSAAVLGIENGWFTDGREIVQERLWLTVYPSSQDHRAVDMDFVWTALGEPVALAGAEGKSYGGLTLRFAPRTNTVITTPLGNKPDDLYITRLPWADLSALFNQTRQTAGAAVFVSPDHPDFPPTWLTRHYGVLCVGWPGVQPGTLKPGDPVRCSYRIWIHRGVPEQAMVERAYEAYRAGRKVVWQGVESGSPRSMSPGKPLSLRAETKADRISLFVEDRLFTEYLYGKDLKYPYFYPAIGPRSGKSVTAHRTEPYPHHSSIFFGCDRVNDGNYWQEGLDQGRIDSRQVRLSQSTGDRIVWEQECRWERPGAEPPFDDHRRITVAAPAQDRRNIDFDITLTARNKVRIQKTNHSLFAVRMAPELSAAGGGTLVNSNGERGEKGTFGRAAKWADYRGNWHACTEGVAILCHPSNRWFPTPWFTRDYGFFSPTPMFWLEKDLLELEKGETITLRYRVVVHADSPSPAELDSLFAAWARE